MLRIATLSHIIVITAILFVYSSQAQFSSSKLCLEFVPPSPAANPGKMWGKCEGELAEGMDLIAGARTARTSVLAGYGNNTKELLTTHSSFQDAPFWRRMNA
jgi:hypothetical protein